MPVPIETLAARYHADEQASSAGASQLLTERRLAGALVAMGWRAASDEPVEALASQLALILDACVDGHRDWRMLRSDVADCLRQYADHLDGSAPSRAEWEPAAAQVIELYASGVDPLEHW